MWVMDLGKSSAVNLQLIYSLITLSDSGTDSTNWRTSDFKPLFSSTLAEYVIPRIAKCSVISSGNIVSSIIKSLLSGTTLGDACTANGAIVPPERFKNLSLDSRNEIERSFVIRPPIASLCRKSVMKLAERDHGSTSLDIHSITRLGSVFRLDKEFLWLREGSTIIPNAREILAGLVARISSDTGLRFFDGDARRFGNIEFAVFPGVDAKAIPKISVSSMPEGKEPKSCKSITVKLHSEALAGQTSVLVNCRLLNDNEIVADECKEGVFPDSPEFVFSAKEQISAGSIKIWLKNPKSSSWNFWHQEDFDLFRTFTVSTSYSGIPYSNWLDQLKNDTSFTKSSTKNEVKKELTPFAAYNRNAGSFFSLDPWHPSGASMVSLIRRLTPPPSDASFLLPADGNETVRIQELSRWLSGTWPKHGRASTCVILDPFFDEPGAEVIRQANSDNVEVIVITNSQCFSYDDSDSLIGALLFCIKKVYKAFLPHWIRSTLDSSKIKIYLSTLKSLLNRWNTREPQRAIRLRSFFSKNEKEFEDRAVRIIDLRSVMKSSKQYFHDRYVLLFNMEGRLESGYNLSNSFQGAMKSYPLLITPIPTDIIESVQFYIRGLGTQAMRSKSDTQNNGYFFIT